MLRARDLGITQVAKRHKYGAKKVSVDGVTFDSTRESRRWSELQALQVAGHISDLERQVVFELAPSVKFAGSKRAKPALRYVADFRYVDKAGALVTEDVKGVLTREFQIKRHLMLSVHGVDVRVVS